MSGNIPPLNQSLAARAKEAERQWKRRLPPENKKRVPAQIDRSVAGDKISVKPVVSDAKRAALVRQKPGLSQATRLHCNSFDRKRLFLGPEFLGRIEEFEIIRFDSLEWRQIGRIVSSLGRTQLGAAEGIPPRGQFNAFGFSRDMRVPTATRKLGCFKSFDEAEAAIMQAEREWGASAQARQNGGRR